MGTDVERLSRWLAAGGGWRVIVRTPSGLTVALLTCDGGEEMDRIVSSDSSFVDCALLPRSLEGQPVLIRRSPWPPSGDS